MRLPTPVPGLVIRHAFLWSHEAARGQTEAAKARPCAIIVAAVHDETGVIRVTVAPITHSPPDDEMACIEIPISVAKRLGLDDDPQWLRFDELNAFDWPGFDLSPIPGTSKFDYGLLPRAFFEKARQAILSRIRAGKKASFLDRDV